MRTTVMMKINLYPED